MHFTSNKIEKDHRTKVENGNTQAVMDGDLDRFMKAYLLNTIQTKKIG